MLQENTLVLLGDLAFYLSTANQYNNSMRIDKNGNVGIGTTKVTDDYKLSVGGNIRAKNIEVSAPSG